MCDEPSASEPIEWTDNPIYCPPAMSDSRFQEGGLEMTFRGNSTDYDLQEGNLLKIYSDEEREERRVYADKQGRARWARDGSLVHFGSLRSQMGTHSETGAIPEQSPYIYVMDDSGNLYVDMHVGNEVYHSSLCATGRPIAAGEIVVYDGVILMMNEESGHYAPKNRVQGAVEFLKKEKGMRFPKYVKVIPSPYESAPRRVNPGTVESRLQKLTRQTQTTAGLKQEFPRMKFIT